MAKGQKKSNREVRKVKQPKAKPAVAARSFLASAVTSSSATKRDRK